jgi:endonuclease YncB( thermonuclease family)
MVDRRHRDGTERGGETRETQGHIPTRHDRAHPRRAALAGEGETRAQAQPHAAVLAGDGGDLPAAVGAGPPGRVLGRAEQGRNRAVPGAPVVDGDSVRLDCGPGRENLNVRLYCIDAPETGQEPWGRIATEHLRGLLGPTITLETIELDRYRRTIGRLRQDGVDINLRLVFDGVAAVYPQYCVDSEYYEAEARARRNDRGIWAEPGPHQRPWEWRRQ